MSATDGFSDPQPEANPYQWPDVRTVNAPQLLRQAFEAGVERGRYEGETVGNASNVTPPDFDEWYAAADGNGWYADARIAEMQEDAR